MSRFRLLPIAALAVIAATVSAQDTKPSTQPAPKPDAKAAPVFALMQTSMGDILLELDAAKAPITVENFTSYADSGFYDGTVFHRVINNFMIQGGGLTADMEKKRTRDGIKNEWRNGLKNKKYTIAMARLGGQADSATSQFFINVRDNGGLDQPRDGAAYAVFGKVVHGMDVVDAIKVVPTGYKKNHKDVPIETITIEKVRTVSAEEAEKIRKGKGSKGSTTRPG